MAELMNAYEGRINDSKEIIGCHKRTSKFDDILESIGEFGLSQIFILLMVCFVDIFNAITMLIPLLSGATPRWRCIENEAGINHTEMISKNGSDVFWDEACYLNDSKCTQFEFDDQFTSIVSEWSLVCENAFASDLITSMQMIGLLFGAATFAQIGDSFGRKKTYLSTFTIYTIAGTLSGFATSWQVYAFLRVVAGFGIGGIFVFGCVYPMEFVGSKWRVSSGTASLWGLGFSCLGVLGMILHDWRSLTICASLLGLTNYLLAFFLPESPRWLIQKHRFKEAGRILSKIAKRNKRSPPSMSDLVALAEQEERDEKNMKKYSYLDVLKHPIYRKRVVILCYCWFATFLFYYVISFNMRNLSGDRYVNLILAGLVDTCAMLAVLFFGNLIGRRYVVIANLVVAVIALAIILGVISNGEVKYSGTVILVFALIGKLSAMAIIAMIQVYTAELYPTVVRNIGLGCAAIAGRIATIVAPQFVFLGEINLATPYIVCILLFIIMCPLTYLLPETKGRPLLDKYDEEYDLTNPTLKSKAINDDQPVVE